MKGRRGLRNCISGDVRFTMYHIYRCLEYPDFLNLSHDFIVIVAFRGVELTIGLQNDSYLK